MRHLLLTMFLAGCSGTFGREPTTVVASDAPVFETIGPGVEAAVETEDPLFRVDGAYYEFRDGVWLESTSYLTGFRTIDHLPGQLLDIHQPRAYARMHVQRTL